MAFLILASLAFLGGAVWSALVNPLMWVICFYAILFSAGDHGTLELLARIAARALAGAGRSAAPAGRIQVSELPRLAADWRVVDLQPVSEAL